jgi:hypothetical protein
MYRNPYEALTEGAGKWFKANFHAHATPDEDNGRFSVSKVVDMYQEAGYQILTVSMQNQFIDITDLGTSREMLTISGIEYVEYDGILLVGIRSFLKGNPQLVIDDCVASGGFAVLCHPNWITEEGLPRALTKPQMRELSRYSGIEILNPAIFNTYKGSGLATELWDEFLSSGKLVWGFANDDFHTYSEFARGWNMIYADRLDYGNVRDAVERGSLYASCGLVLQEFSFAEGVVAVEANFARTPAHDIEYKFVGDNGAILDRQVGRRAEYRLRGTERYVRVHASSEGGTGLWTQPVFDEAGLTPT